MMVYWVVEKEKYHGPSTHLFASEQEQQEFVRKCLIDYTYEWIEDDPEVYKIWRLLNREKISVREARDDLIGLGYYDDVDLDWDVSVVQGTKQEELALYG